uniref:MYND-type domain-containing protein n=1 Tax=Mycena chlorophos TaxID=658473 RepID=A0ABQ0LC59_MYCCL|nr:predicted protein [Mycena chlorophos]
MQCVGCSVARYCDVDCQRKNWKIHQHLCRIQQRSLAGLDVARQTEAKAFAAFYERWGAHLCDLALERMEDGAESLQTHCLVVRLHWKPAEPDSAGETAGRYAIHSAQMRRDTDALDEDLEELAEIRPQIEQQLRALPVAPNVVRVMPLARTHCVCFHSEPLQDVSPGERRGRQADARE